jgi:hypothetical protein
MSTLHLPDYPTEPASESGKAVRVISSMACVASVVVFCLSIFLLSGTHLGFALAFGSGIIAYESVVVFRRSRETESSKQTRALA